MKTGIRTWKIRPSYRRTWFVIRKGTPMSDTFHDISDVLERIIAEQETIEQEPVGQTSATRLPHIDRILTNYSRDAA